MLWHKFALRSGDQMAALARALQSGNFAELGREAQTLGRVAAGLAAEALCACAGELESSAQRGEREAAAAIMLRTREEIERTVETAAALLAELTATERGRAS